MERQITIEEAKKLSRDLAQRAKECHPDCIISIKNGGWLIGRVIAQELDLPHHSLKVKKWYSKASRFCYIVVRFLRNDLPSPLNRMCEYLVTQLIHFISRTAKPKVRGEFIGAIDLNAKILLVDDDIGTGRTMTSALNFLQQEGHKNIFTAVVIQYGGFTADYSILPSSSSISFPWPWRMLTRKQQAAPL